MAAGHAAAFAAANRSRIRRAKCWPRSRRTARRSSPTSRAPPAGWPAKWRTRLWELVAAGLVTADGFENLRALLDPKRRRGEGKGRTARPRHAPGRWALLRHTGAPRRWQCRGLRAPVAGALGRGVPRCGRARAAGARLARSAGGAAPHGIARRNPRRPLRGRLHRRAVRAARSARRLRAIRRSGETAEAPEDDLECAARSRSLRGRWDVTNPTRAFHLVFTQAGENRYMISVSRRTKPNERRGKQRYAMKLPLLYRVAGTITRLRVEARPRSRYERERHPGGVSGGDAGGNRARTGDGLARTLSRQTGDAVAPESAGGARRLSRSGLTHREPRVPGNIAAGKNDGSRVSPTCGTPPWSADCMPSGIPVRKPGTSPGHPDPERAWRR